MRVIFGVLMLLGLSSLQPYQAPQTEIEVVLKNIKNARGVFVISFYNNENSFPKPGKEAFIKKVAVNDTIQRTVAVKVPAEGWYAIAMFQDEDGTGKIKQDKIGIPLEAYGFSNNIHPKTSAPTFTACRFYVKQTNNPPMVINLIHPRFVREN